MAGVKHQRNFFLIALLGVEDHRFFFGGSDERQFNFFGYSGYFQFYRFVGSAIVVGDDLVVVFVGRDIGGGGKFVLG